MKHILFIMFTLTGFLLPAQEVLTWPREHVIEGHKVIIYQPQIDEWQKYQKLIGKAAISVQLKGAKAPAFGAIYFNLVTEVDMTTKLVAMKKLNLSSISFPHLDKAQASTCQAIGRPGSGSKQQVMPVRIVLLR